MFTTKTNDEIEEVLKQDKIAVQKSKCPVCGSKKSTFLEIMKKQNWAF